ADRDAALLRHSGAIRNRLPDSRRQEGGRDSRVSLLGGVLRERSGLDSGGRFRGFAESGQARVLFRNGGCGPCGVHLWARHSAFSRAERRAAELFHLSLCRSKRAADKEPADALFVSGAERKQSSREERRRLGTLNTGWAAVRRCGQPGMINSHFSGAPAIASLRTGAYSHS